MRRLLVALVLGLSASAPAGAADIAILGVTAAPEAGPEAQPLGDWVPPAERPRAFLESVARAVKAAVEPLGADEVRALMAQRYRALRLWDGRRWRLAELVPFDGTLLPAGMDGRALGRFVDEMVEAACKSPYVLAFARAARRHEFPRLRARAAAEGPLVFRRVVINAMVLERLVRVMIADDRTSAACRAHWLATPGANPSPRSATEFFGWLKSASVDVGIASFNRSHESGVADPETLRWTLPGNILEAVGADLFLAATGPREARSGRLANARAGLALIRYGPHGAGPSRFTFDRRMIGIDPLAVKEWDDLYGTWNMSFVTVLPNWPEWMVKLLVPAVNDYAAEPSTYMYRRALALEIQLYANRLESADGAQPEYDWTDPQLTKVWGETNLESARDYEWRAAAEGQARNGPRESIERTATRGRWPGSASAP